MGSTLGSQFTLCEALHFWNLETRLTEFRNSTNHVLFTINFRFMDRAFRRPAGFRGDFWVMAFDIVYLLAKVRIFYYFNVLWARRIL